MATLLTRAQPVAVGAAASTLCGMSDQRVLYAENTSGGLSDHERLVAEMLEQAREEHGKLTVDSVSLATVETGVNVTKYTTAVLITIAPKSNQKNYFELQPEAGAE